MSDVWLFVQQSVCDINPIPFFTVVFNVSSVILSRRETLLLSLFSPSGGGAGHLPVPHGGFEQTEWALMEGSLGST